MSKFHLFFTGRGDALLKQLQKEGLIEIKSLPEEFGFSPVGVDTSQLQSRIAKVDFMKELIARVEGREPAGKVVVSEKEEQDILGSFDLEGTHEEYRSIFEDIKRRERVIEKVDTLKEEIADLLNLDLIPLKLFQLKKFSFAIFRLGGKNRVVPDLIGSDVSLLSEGKKSSIFLVIFPKDDRQAVTESLSEAGADLIRIRRWNKRPAQMMNVLSKIEDYHKSGVEELEGRLASILSCRNKILVLSDRLNTYFAYHQAFRKSGLSKFVKGFSGWIRKKDVALFKKILDDELPESYLYISEFQEDEDIPIDLENQKAIEPFEVVTDLYGRPVYRNVDPTASLSLFFIVSFAFCLTDAGYGALLVLTALILKKKFRLMPAFVKFAKLLLYGGIATFFMGVITGGWFGDLLSRMPETLAPVRFLKGLVVLDPLKGGETAFTFLIWALVIGYIQIVYGLMINLFTSVRNAGAKNSGIPFVLLLIQLLLGALILAFIGVRQGLVSPVMITALGAAMLLSFVYLMFAESRTQQGLMMKIFWALYSAYNVVASNLLGDILSYSRLFGLGLTTAVLGLVVNEMVFISSGIPYLGIIIAALLFIAGHIGNLAINLLGGYVHTSRLQYLEFFTKFYQAGGRSFNPFKEARQYTIKEEAGSTVAI